MRIGFENLYAINNTKPIQKKAVEKKAETAGDQMKTSDEARMLSRNMEKLQQLDTGIRPEVLKKFEGFADAPLELDDETVDTMLSKMFS